MKIHNNPFSSLTITCFFIFLTIIHKSLSARSLNNNPSHHRGDNRVMSFYMIDILSEKKPIISSSSTQQLIPFSKPLGFFPPINGIEINIPDSIPMTELPSSQTLDLQGIGLTFPSRATLHELELGVVTTIDEDIYQGSEIFGSSFLGKAQGLYVSSSEDGVISTNQMVAMTTSFASENDCLRFFGLLKSDDIIESHIAVIGGSGKYKNANGYAIVKTVKLSSSSNSGEYKVLQFNVYLG